MPTEQTIGPAERSLLVAGDICLDVVGVAIPPSASDQGCENWKLTGEVRTHFLPGGTLLLAELLRAPLLAGPLTQAERQTDEQVRKQQLSGENARAFRRCARLAALREYSPAAEDKIPGPRPVRPEAIVEGNPGALYVQDFHGLADRFRRQELVHSLLTAKPYPWTSDPKDKRTVLRIEREHGFSGSS